MKNIKWLFFSLLVINILYFVWMMRDQRIATSQVDGKPTLFLLSETTSLEKTTSSVEREGGKAVTIDNVKFIDSDVTPDNISGAKNCTHIELFGERASAEKAIDLLKTKKLRAELEEIPSEIGSDFLVYLPPFESHEVALVKLRELHAQAIDSFIISTGPRVNGISLGIFAKGAAAQTALSQFKAKGVNATLEEIPRIHMDYALKVHDITPTDISSDLWSNILQLVPKGLQKKTIACE
jgi:hypothetical protein